MRNIVIETNTALTYNWGSLKAKKSNFNCNSGLCLFGLQHPVSALFSNIVCHKQHSPISSGKKQMTLGVYPLLNVCPSRGLQCFFHLFPVQDYSLEGKRDRMNTTIDVNVPAR